MAKELLINVSEREECRIAVLEDKKLQELYMERTSSTSHVGNVYKGKVTNVEASIQAAFVDFGLGRNGFLHISDLMPTYFGRKGEEIQETVGRKMARRDRPPIQRCLRRGDEIVVQIIKEGIGTKGPTLTTYLSIPGKVLVMMPGVGKSGVSRKIEDEDERRRLRKILDELDPPDDAGFIIRTAGVGLSKDEIERDLTYLTRLWSTFKKKRDAGPGPIELYTEGDLITRTVRDVFTADVDRIVVDNKDVADRVKEVVKLANPRGKDRVELYDDPIPLFHRFGIEREIELMYSRHVPLQSGGSLVIDSTEAIVAIDVNTGKSRDFSDAETAAFRTDLEAADEICRQLKLRDLGGVIICDFIDLRYERHRRELEERIENNLKGDRAKTKVLRMSQFGIIEMTRQRMRPSLKRSVYFDCPHCKGAGLVKTPESMSLDVMRRLRIAINDKRVHRLELTVCTDVAFYLQNKKRDPLSNLEYDYAKQIVIRADASLGLDEMRVDLYDDRDGLVFIEELGMMPQPPHTTQLGPRPAQRGGKRGGRGGDRDRNQGRGDQKRLPEPQTRRVHDEDEGDIEERDERFERNGEDEADSREPVAHDRQDHRDDHDDRDADRDADREADREDDHGEPETREAEGDHGTAPSAGQDEYEEQEHPDDTRFNREQLPPPPPQRGRFQKRGGFQRGGGQNRTDNRRNDNQNRGASGGGQHRGDQRNRDDQPRRNDQPNRNDRQPPRNDQSNRNAPRNDQRNEQRNEQRNDQRSDQRNDQPQRSNQPQRGNQPPRNNQPPRSPQPPREVPQPQNRDNLPIQAGQPLPPGSEADWQTGDQQEGGQKRRRRRRGRRGRGRNRQGQDGQPMVGAEAGEQQGVGPADSSAEPEDFHEEGGPDQIEDRYDDHDQPVEPERGYDREPDADHITAEHQQDREPFRAETQPVANSQTAVEAERDDRDDFQQAAEAAAEMFGEREAESLAHDDELAAEEAAPAVEAAPAADSGAKPKRRTKAATTTKAPAKKPAAKPAAKKAVPVKAAKAPAKPKAKAPAAKSTAKSSAKATPAKATRAKAKPVSVDRHLVDDEPVLPQPARRPRSARDLDAIPDDYDE